MTKIYIACGAHGVQGAVVEYTHQQLVRDIKKARKVFNAEEARQTHKMLAESLTKMLPDIMNKGISRDAYGEIYTKEIFDQDLVCVAIYDHIGNGKRIGLVQASTQQTAH